jgi:hypothetical protein
MLHSVHASSFADPADLAAFKRAKARGLTDQQAFKYGDNGIGCWGDDCTAGSGPACALPPEDWKPLFKPHNAKVRVTFKSKSVTCFLRDTMPHRSAIENGAGIDLNPDAVRAIGLEPPIMVPVTWEFV